MHSLHLPIKVVPGASQTQVVGRLGNRLKVKVQAAAEGGQANRAVVELLATALGVPEKSIRIIFGQSFPEKLVEISLEDEELLHEVQGVIEDWMK